MVLPCQPGILEEVPSLARYLSFTLQRQSQLTLSLKNISEEIDGNNIVLGIGRSLALALGREIPGLKTFPSYAGAGFEVPSTPMALWLWLQGTDRGELFHRTRRMIRLLTPAFKLDKVIDAFRYKTGFDLTGYKDGTENPEGAAAVAAAIVTEQGAELDGSSFAAVQTWVHDLDCFDAMTGVEQDHTIGRRRSDNEEIADAPAAAHVKRTAQESFQPEAYILRRSMPWADNRQAGLVFVAFGNSFNAFESLLHRMTGQEDGIPDALFRFTRPVTGAYFWCPPLYQGKLNLAALGI